MIRRLILAGTVAAVLAAVYVALYFRAFRPTEAAAPDWRERDEYAVTGI